MAVLSQHYLLSLTTGALGLDNCFAWKGKTIQASSGVEITLKASMPSLQQGARSCRTWTPRTSGPRSSCRSTPAQRRQDSTQHCVPKILSTLTEVPTQQWTPLLWRTFQNIQHMPRFGLGEQSRIETSGTLAHGKAYERQCSGVFM